MARLERGNCPDCSGIAERVNGIQAKCTDCEALDALTEALERVRPRLALQGPFGRDLYSNADVAMIVGAAGRQMVLDVHAKSARVDSMNRAFSDALDDLDLGDLDLGGS